MSIKSSKLPDKSTKELLEKGQDEKRALRSIEELCKTKELANKDKGQRQKLQLRDDFTKWAKRVNSMWIIFIILLLIVIGVFNGFGIELYPSEVLITLLATTTINVIGLSAIIIKGLFPREKN